MILALTSNANSHREHREGNQSTAWNSVRTSNPEGSKHDQVPYVLLKKPTISGRRHMSWPTDRQMGGW